MNLFAQVPAFPGAQGFGRFATGGRFGSVYHVTNTNDSGGGSFRMGATTPNCTIVFDVGGVIRINSLIDVAPNITIAGQTAPGGGVTIYGHRMSYSGANNTITRFIRVRMGINGDGNDAIGIADGHDMIFDHVSDSWGEDETFSISGSSPAPTNITIQSTIIAQGLQDHSAGGLIQTIGGVSIVRSFYIDNNIRNPKVKFTNEFVNNVVYNWGEQAYILGESSGQSCANVISNYFINGPTTSSSAFNDGNLNFHLYASGNWQDANLNGVLDGAEIPQAAYGVVDWIPVPFPYPITNALPTLTALKLVISDAGASWQRDIVDERLVTELTSWGTLGETIRSEFDFPMSGPGTVRNGAAPRDWDFDGLPDYWELGLGMNTNSPNNNDPSAGGYTKLEDYLNWLADPHGVALTNVAVDIDLRQFTRGFLNSNPTYSLNFVTNGAATLINGHIVHFVPTTDYVGPAGFQWTVLDADGSTITRPMNLFFTPFALPFNPIWRGDDLANNWNASGDLNWFDSQSLLYPFHTGDNVTFDDSGSTNPAVNLIGSLQPAAVTFATAKNYTLSGSGSLDGSMTLIKTGSGTVTLSTTNNFTGNTTVSNGTLLVHGALNLSTVTVRSGGKIGGNGQLNLAPTMQTGSGIAPGNGIGGAGTFTIANSLTESGGINNYFDLSDDPPGLVKTNDQMIVTGAFTVTGKNFIRVNLLNGPLANGVYTLIKYGTFTNSLTNFALINANGVLTNPPGEIAILVDNVRPPENLTWAGNSVNNNWDNGLTTNWLNGASPEAFYFFDTILFNDSGSTNPPVNLIGSLTPASVTVNATKNWTFSGNGSISGYGTFTKTNSGVLTMLATNDYAGPTVIAGGILSVPVIANVGIPGPLGAADSSPDNVVFNGGTLRYTGASAGTDRSATLNPPGGFIDVSSSATTLTLNGLITGTGPLIKTGPGRLAMNTINTFSGGIVVNQGVIRLDNDVGFGTGPLTLNGTNNATSLQFNINGGALNNLLVVVGPNNFTSNNVNNSVNDMAGSGTLTLNFGSTFSFGANMFPFSGTIKVGNITNLRFNGSAGSSNAVFDIGTASALLNTRNGLSFIYLGALIGGPNTMMQGASSANSFTTYVIGGRNLDTTFAGRISEVIPARTAAITKVGTGTFTLTGANTHTGPTTINGGTLLVNNATGFGTGTNTVTVNSGGTLGGFGSIWGAVIVNAGGTLAPGSNNVGTLTLRSNLTLNAASILNFDIGTTNDKVAVTANLTLGGTLNIAALAGFSAGTYPLFTYGGALSGSLPVIGTKPAGYYCTVNTGTAGQVRLVVQVQTPPIFGSITMANGNLVMSGSGGLSNSVYYVMASTNLALPSSNWIPVATNQFNAAGNFIFTNAIVPGRPQQFYRLQLP